MPLNARPTVGRETVWVGLAMAAATIAVWAPFLSDPTVLYRYWDGPLYAFVAKTLYHIPADHPFRADLGPSFFASYLPAYPLIVRAMTLVTGGRTARPSCSRLS